jgi:GT2 family glycosyltransferase
VPGQVAALNAGLEHMTGDIVAITDDDTAPRRDWLLNIEQHFRNDPRLGGLGGRDWVHQDGKVLDGVKLTVGKIQWFGRMIGNHHLGAGGPREVDLLKGANMAYRSIAIRNIRFRSCLRGTGAQVYNDMDFCLQVKKAGWKLVYDPAVAVDHYPAPRYDEDARNTFHPAAVSNAAYNETLIMMNYLGRLQGWIYLLWVFAVGSLSSPGFLQWLRLLVKDPKLAGPKWKAAVHGRLDAIRARKKGGTGVEGRNRDAAVGRPGRSGNHAAASASRQQANR